MKSFRFRKKIKNILFFMFIFLLSTNFLEKVCANNEDRANRMFNMQYKSFFIGTIIEENNDKFKIKFDQVFIGDNLETIEVDKFYKYSFSSLVPEVNDHIVAILNNDDTVDLTWIFKVTSTNYKTLYLANDLDPENSEVKVFQHLINEGEYFLKSEEFEANMKQSKNKNYKTKAKSDSEKIAELDKKENEEFEKKINSVYAYFRNPVLLIVPAILFFLIMYTLKLRKNFRKEVEKDDEEYFS